MQKSGKCANDGRPVLRRIAGARGARCRMNEVNGAMERKRNPEKPVTKEVCAPIFFVDKETNDDDKYAV